MKRRFSNLLAKKRKKNGIFILACAVSLTTVLGKGAACHCGYVCGR